MFPNFTLRGVARELVAAALRPVADTIVERLGGEPAGFCERLIDSTNADIERLTKERNTAKEYATELHGMAERAVDQRRAAEEKDRKGVAALAEAMAELDRLRARVKELESSAEPACYGMFDAGGIVDVVDGKRGPGAFCKVPLYRHPPKLAAIGVDDHGWAVLTGLSDERQFIYLDRTTILATREIAEGACAKSDSPTAQVVRVVPAETVVVELQTIREHAHALLGVKEALNASACELFGHRLLAAIGDTAPARAVGD